MPAPTIPDPTTPTSQQVYDTSRLKWLKLGIESPSDLDDIVVGSAAYLVTMTGRYWSDWPPPTTFVGEILTDRPEMIPLALVAHRLRTEQIVVQSQPGYTDTAGDDLIQTMSVGGYSETRRDTATLRGGRQAQKPLMNTHPGLNALIEALQTEDRFEFWLWRLGGQMPPAFQVEEVDWSFIGKSMLTGASYDMGSFLPGAMSPL